MPGPKGSTGEKGKEGQAGARVSKHT